jgi:hypothetical protein
MRVKCPYCRIEFDPAGSSLGRWIGARIVHRWSGKYGTIIREYDKVPDHAIIEWDEDGERQRPYRLDVTRPMYALRISENLLQDRRRFI